MTNRIDNTTHLLVRQFIIHGQANQTICKAVAIGQGWNQVGMFLVVPAQMQTQVMKDGKKSVFFQIGQQLSSFFQIPAHEIEHVGVIGCILRNLW